MSGPESIHANQESREAGQIHGREWKPGDVAMRHSALSAAMPSMLVPGCGHEEHDAGPHWHHANGGWDSVDGRSTYRPLVVIDPEDREQVERLTGALAINGANPNDRNYWRETQAALRSLIAPPKPDEPTGLGAVVEDAEGRRWVHAPDDALDDEPWVLFANNPDGGECAGYSHVHAVRILSPGVTQ